MKRKAIILLIWIAIWQAIAMAVGNSLLLPSPIETIGALFQLIRDGSFYLDVLATIVRCIVAIVLSLVLGFICALAAYKNSVVKDILSLPISLFKAIPIMAVAIYMILLMSPDNVPVLVCWVMGFPIVYTNLLTGLENMDRSLLEMAQVYNISGKRKVRLIYMPSLFPYFSSAMSILAGMSWKAIVTAEVLSIPKFSLGYELMNSKYYLNTSNLFAYVLTIIAISVAFEKLIKIILAKATAHNYEHSKVAKLAKNSTTSCSNDETPSYGDVATAAHYGSSTNVATRKDIAVSLSNIDKSFGDKEVLHSFNMKLATGKVTAIMGSSGKGKTTIARILTGLETVDAGKVEAPIKIAYLFQEDRLLPWLNVYDNLAIVMDKVDDDKIHQMLELVGLDEEAWKLPGELSGGMSYRVAMARAFIYDASFLIADEPFRGLDDETKNKAIDKLWKPGIVGKTVLLITHSAEDAKLADKVISL